MDKNILYDYPIEVSVNIYIDPEKLEWKINESKKNNSNNSIKIDRNKNTFAHEILAIDNKLYVLMIIGLWISPKWKYLKNETPIITRYIYKKILVDLDYHIKKYFS